MKEIEIKAPIQFDFDRKQWPAKYVAKNVQGVALFVCVESRSDFTVIVTKSSDGSYFGSGYYISIPAFRAAIPVISTISDSFWITEKLIACDMPAADAVTVAAVLRDIGDF